MYGLAADLIVTVHLGYVLFCVAGFVLVVAGALRGWAWIRNRAFRFLHLAAVALVAVEASAGLLCPLTLWEYQLRELAGQTSGEPLSFVARLVRGIIFYDLPSWVFVLAYLAFALAVGILLFLVPPAPPRRANPRQGPSR